jgi:NADH:ubiquinone oxidoreductase subunit 2 (subunit N)
MLTWLSLASLGAFFAVAALDGFYFHILRFRLWAHADSRTEHLVHTVRALLMAPIVWLLYLGDRASLSVAAALVALDFVATVLDVAIEPRSRRRFGGLPRAEIAAHVLATVFHVAAIALAFASRLSAAHPAHPECVTLLAFGFIGGSALAAVHHVVLVACGLRLSSWQVERR